MVIGGAGTGVPLELLLDDEPELEDEPEELDEPLELPEDELLELLLELLEDELVLEVRTPDVPPLDEDEPELDPLELDEPLEVAPPVVPPELDELELLLEDELELDEPPLEPLVVPG